ncbi:MAG: response regulator [Planctomycetaceae bacterium]|nr:response regulator [Planctomycetaceae bacterium]
MTSVLVVEDSLTQSTHIRLMLKSAEFEVFVAENGCEALEILQKHQPDIVLTDLQMPQMDGLELVQAIRDRYPHLPVVLMTQHGSEEIALDALRQGAASYLPKSQLQHHMVATLDEILESARLAHRKDLVQQRRFRTEIQYRLENDPTLIAPLSAQVEQELEDQKFGNPTLRRQMGVALRKAIDNAIFHGNLELSESDRAEGELVYRDLAERRRTKPPWCDRKVWVTLVVDEADARFLVRDEGPGFTVPPATDFVHSANLDEMRGSGLLLIHTFMDRVEHNSLGNEITMIKHRPTDDSSANNGPLLTTSSPTTGTSPLFELETLEDTLIVIIQSEKIGFEQGQLARELEDINRRLDQPEFVHALIDFSQIVFFSSTLLEVLRQIWMRIKQRGGEMVLCGLSPGGQEILRCSKFDTLWSSYGSRTEALMALHDGYND